MYFAEFFFYLCNSPIAVWKSLKRYPFVKVSLFPVRPSKVNCVALGKVAILCNQVTRLVLYIYIKRNLGEYKKREIVYAVRNLEALLKSVQYCRPSKLLIIFLKVQNGFQDCASVTNFKCSIYLIIKSFFQMFWTSVKSIFTSECFKCKRNRDRRS